MQSASDRGTPMAVRTCDGSVAPVVQAEPPEAATPCRSRCISIASASAPGTATLSTCGRAAALLRHPHHVGHRGPDRVRRGRRASAPSARRLAGLFGGRQLGRPAQRHGAGHVLGAGPDAELLAAAVDDRLDRRPAPHDQRADALRRPDLVAGQGDERGVGGLDRHRDLAEGLHGVGVEHRAGGATARPMSSTGCTVPTSLFTHMTETTAGWSASTRSSASRSTTPSRVHREDRTRCRPGAPPRARPPAPPCARWRTAAACIGRPAAPAASAAPTMARLSASVPPEVNTTWFGSAPTAAATLRRASSSAGARRPPEAVRAGRVAEGRRPEEGQHGLEHLGANRGRGGVVEIDWGQRHGRQVTYMLATSRVSTSSTRTVSWVKNGSPNRVRISEP